MPWRVPLRSPGECRYSDAICAYDPDGRRQPADRRFCSDYAKILTLDPDNVEALFFTGLAANGAGDKEEARRLWEKAKSGLPENSPQRAAVQRQINSLGNSVLPSGDATRTALY